MAEETAAGIEAAQPDVTAEEAEQPAETAKPTETETPIEEETPALTVQAALTMPTADLTEEAENEVEYKLDGGTTWTSSTLADAVTAIGKQTGTIKVLKDITVSAEIKITGNVTLITDGKDVVIKRANTLTDAPVISVASGATLNLGTETAMENTLTIDGGAVWNGNEGYPNTEADQWSDKSNNTGVRGNFAIIRTDGTFNMYENVILQNHHNNTSIYDNHSGGGVDIENTGVFNMYGGKIWKCSSASQAEWGGGVTVAGLDYELETPATFNMYGGEICYNTAGIGGGVSVGNPNGTHNHPAIFNMYNGNIHHNKAGSMNAYSGAGVYVADNAVFTMEDGSITENTAEAKNGYALGGGVESVGTFNMNGGTISGNTAKSGGAGIFLMYNNNVDCTANITGGNIINNNGEGIFINDTKAYLNISGNVNISGNTTTGIYIEKDASPINVAKILNVENTIDVNSAITDDGTVIVTFADGLNASDYTNVFKNASKSMIVKENKLVIGVQTYAVTVTDPIYMVATYPGGTDSKIGTITVTGASDLAAVSEGTELTLKIDIANDSKAKNHSFVKWVVKTESGTDVTVTDNKFTMPDENVTVSATFKKQQFTVTTQTAGNGTITVINSTGGKSAWGEEVEYRVEANAHYDVASITVNGEAVTLNEIGIYSFTMPQKDATISANFKKHKYNITIEGDNITYTIPGAETFDWGESVTVTITPEQWYSITKVEASDSITVTDNGDGIYSFVMPSADVILTVTTTRPTYTVKFDTKGGSTVIDPQVIANGESVVKPRAPEYLNRGFAGWCTSTDFKPENKYNFEQPVTDDITLYARWFLWGDVNGDGRADTTDAYIIQRCRVGLEKYTDMANRMAGFVSGLDKANPDTTDAYDIQRLRVGLITRFSVEDSAHGYEFNLEEGTYTVPR